MENLKLIDSRRKETIIEDVKELQVHLMAMRDLKPQIALLEIPDFGILTIGIGPYYGFVEVMKISGEPPYLLAMESEPEPKQIEAEFLEFDSGGTLTPIPTNRCVPTELVIRIASDILENKELPEYAKWQEE